MSDKLTRIQKRLKNKRDWEHTKKWQQVCKKIRKLKLKRKYTKLLIKDSTHCNSDLLEVLYQSPQFTSLADYIATINAYLRSETDCYDYKGVDLEYKVGKMEQLMKIITNQHNIIDRLDKLREMTKNGT